MSISAGELYINVIAKIGQLTSNLKKGTLNVSRFSAETTSKLKTWTKTNEAQFKRMGLAVGAFAVAGAIAFKKFSDAAIQNASALEESTSKFITVFGDKTQAMDKVVQELTNSYAMSTSESRKYLSSVQDLLVPMGVNKDLAAKLSTNMVKLTADIGSFNDQPTADVMRDIQSALTGEFQTMKKYGVVLNEATIQEEIFNLGLASTKKEITAAHKAQAAYNLIVRGSKAAIGDMARTQDGYANVTKKLTALQTDFTAMVGKIFLPMATEAKKRIIEWAQASGGLGEKAKTVGVVILKSMKGVSNAFNGFKILFNGVIAAVAIGIESATKSIVGFSNLLVTAANAYGKDLALMPGKIGRIGDALVGIKKLEVPKIIKDFSESAKKGLTDVIDKTIETNKKFNKLIKDVESTDAKSILRIDNKDIEESLNVSTGLIDEANNQNAESYRTFFDGVKFGWAEITEKQVDSYTQGQRAAMTFNNDWTRAIGDTVGAFIQGENDKVNIQAAAGRVMSNAAGRYASEQFARILPTMIDQIGVALGMGAAFSGKEGAVTGGWKGALKDVGLFLGTGVAAMLAGRGLASKFHADGGWLSNNQSGGMLTGGSGFSDDIFLGNTGGNTNHFAMGGEFVMNKKATAKNLPLLHAMNSKKYAMGGGVDTGSMDTASIADIRGNKSGWKGLAENLNIGGFATFLKGWGETGNVYKAIGQAIGYYGATIGGGFTAKGMSKQFYGLGGSIKKHLNPMSSINPKQVWEDTLDSWSYPIESAARALLTPGLTSHNFKLSKPDIPSFATGTGLGGVNGSGLAYLHDKEIVLNKNESDNYRDSGLGEMTVVLNNYGTIASAQDENELFQRMTDKIKNEIRGAV